MTGKYYQLSCAIASGVEKCWHSLRGGFPPRKERQYAMPFLRDNEYLKFGLIR